MMKERRLRVAWFSDLSGENSISAYCSKLLIPILSQRHDVELFSNSFESEWCDTPHQHYLKAYQRHRQKPFDVFFYQIEDGKRSRFVRSSIGIMPGVTWFHDLFFEDLGPEATHTSPWEHSIQQFYDPSLPFSGRLTAPHQLWPRAFRELSLSPLCLFSSQWALTESKTMVSDRLESELGAHRAAFLGIPVAPQTFPPLPRAETLRVASLCGVGHEGRPHKALRALSSLKHPWTMSWLIDPSEQRAAERLLREFAVEGRVELVVGRTPEQWSRLLATAHVALHLRTSSFGHLGPYIQLSLLSGRLTALSDMAQGEDFAGELVCKIAPGTTEASQLLHLFERAASLDVSSMTKDAVESIKSHHSPDLIAQQLSQLLESASDNLRVSMAKWDTLYERARLTLFDEVRSIVNSGDTPGLSPYSRIIEPSLSALSGR